MIEYKNDKRITFKECLAHPWFSKAPNKKIDVKAMIRLKEYRHQSKLQAAAMNQLVKQISPEFTKHLREQFEAIDTDGNGILDYAEIKAASIKCRDSCGKNKKHRLLKMITKEID